MASHEVLAQGRPLRTPLRSHIPASLLRWEWRSILAFSLPMLLYLVTMAPTIYNLDSAELTTAAATGGIVRATGYPLYLILGRVWSELPVGDVGYRMNLLSAVSGALTVLLTERLLRRLRVGPWATFGALGLLTVSTFFWALSLIAEVYTPHTVLMATLILLVLRWSNSPTPARLAQVMLIFGLSLGHHAATILLAPGFAWYMLTTAPRRVLAPRALLMGGIALLLGLSVYLYLPYQFSTQPAFNYAGTFGPAGEFRPIDLQSPDGLWWLVTGRAFSSQMMGYTPAELRGEAVNFVFHLWRAFFAVGIGPGLLGMVLLLRRNWRLGGMFALLFAVNAAFYIDYRVIDKETMFLPTYVIWAVWLGVGLQWLLDWIQSGMEGNEQRWTLFSLRWGIVALVLLATLARWSLVNLSRDFSTRERGEEILQEVERDALVFGWWETVPVVQYLQQVEGQRPDVTAINRFLIAPHDMEQMIRNNIHERPVYIDGPPQHYLSTWYAYKEGVLYRLEPSSQSSGSKGSDSNRQQKRR